MWVSQADFSLFSPPGSNTSIVSLFPRPAPSLPTCVCVHAEGKWPERGFSFIICPSPISDPSQRIGLNSQLFSFTPGRANRLPKAII